MKYAEIASARANRFRLPSSHPILAQITIDPADWPRLQQLYSDNPATRILGHDDPENGVLTVYISCASLETRRRLEDGCWG
jgi:hypothetical protein